MSLQRFSAANALAVAVLSCRLLLGSASTFDGSQYYVALDRLLGSNNSSDHRIFRFSGSGFDVVDQGPDGAFQVGAVSVSSDGAVWSYTASRFIPDGGGGRPPTTIVLIRSVIYMPGKAPLELGVEVQLSQNGRYALLSESRASTALLDLQTGEQTPISTAGSFGGLTSDGRVLLWSGSPSATQSQLQIWSKQGTQTFPVSGPLQFAAINDQGTTVIYTSTTQQIDSLHWIDLPTGQDLLIDQGIDYRFALISNDGSVVVYRRLVDHHPSVWSTSGEIRPITDLTDVDCLSGNGQVLFGSSPDGRLVRFDLASGVAQVLIERLPGIGTIDPAGGLPFSPGSLYTLRGSALTDYPEAAGPNEATPLPDSLGGVEVKIGCLSAKLLEVTADAIRFQVPFETTLGVLNMSVTTGSVFDHPPFPVTIQDISPSFLPYDFNPDIWHQNFESRVTPQNPATPGEIVHFFMVGLGTVQPPIPSGLPAPVSPLSRLANTIECHVDQSTTPLAVRFAGLAPTTVGTYQLDVEMPDDSFSGRLFMQCEIGSVPHLTSSIPIPFQP